MAGSWEFYAEQDKKIAECEAHRDADAKAMTILSFHVLRDGRAIRLLFNELHSVNPSSHTLAIVAATLREKFDPAMMHGDV